MSAPDANGWMPIETAPLDGTTVDLWAKIGGTKDAYARVADCSWGPMVDWLGEERDDWFGLYVGMHLSYEKPTHWRPLPKPPIPHSSQIAVSSADHAQTEPAARSGEKSAATNPEVTR